MYFETANELFKSDAIGKGADEQEKYIRSIIQDELNKKNEPKGNDVATTGIELKNEIRKTEVGNIIKSLSIKQKQYSANSIKPSYQSSYTS